MKTTLLLLGALSSHLVGVGATFVTWGDSLTFGYGGTPYPMQLEALTGVTTLNRGINGETSTQIAARFAAQPSLFGEHVVIWVGRNNLYEHEGVQSDIASMVSRLTTTDYLVLGVIHIHDEHIGSAYYDACTAADLGLVDTYGSHLIDIHHVLLDANDLVSPIDVSDVGFGMAPVSLRSDAHQLNSAGHGVVAHTFADYFTVTSHPPSGLSSSSITEPAQPTVIVAIGCAARRARPAKAPDLVLGGAGRPVLPPLPGIRSNPRPGTGPDWT